MIIIVIIIIIIIIIITTCDAQAVNPCLLLIRDYNAEKDG